MPLISTPRGFGQFGGHRTIGVGDNGFALNLLRGVTGIHLGWVVPFDGRPSAEGRMGRKQTIQLLPLLLRLLLGNVVGLPDLEKAVVNGFDQLRDPPRENLLGAGNGLWADVEQLGGSAN